MSTHLFARAALLTGILSLAACGGLVGPPDAGNIYAIHAVLPAPAAGPAVAFSLNVAMPDAPSSLDSPRLALETGGADFDYYAGTQLSQRLPGLVQRALVEGLENSHRVPHVAREAEGINGDYLLLTDVRDFTAHYTVRDGIPTASVRLVARVVTMPGRKLVGEYQTSQQVAATANSVPAVIAAFNQALGAAVGQVVDWTVALPAPEAPPARPAAARAPR